MQQQNLSRYGNIKDENNIKFFQGIVVHLIIYVLFRLFVRGRPYGREFKKSNLLKSDLSISRDTLNSLFSFSQQQKADPCLILNRETFSKH